MQIELMATYFVLRRWKENPGATKKEIGIYYHWTWDKQENNVPLSQKEVRRMKEFQRKYCPSAYYKLFPEEKI